MSKSHRDNHKARKKIGTVAFEKKANRRAPDIKRVRCSICGTMTRIAKVVDGACSSCRERFIEQN